MTNECFKVLLSVLREVTVNNGIQWEPTQADTFYDNAYSVKIMNFVFVVSEYRMYTTTEAHKYHIRFVIKDLYGNVIKEENLMLPNDGYEIVNNMYEYIKTHH